MRFIISTESLNCYGFRVLTSGIDLVGFRKNPVMLYMHDRSGRFVPIGHWEDVRIEGTQLTGEAVFDEADEFARTIKAKVDAGTLRACSPGLNIVEWSEDPTLLVQGQTAPTVTKCTLLEVSIVDVPGNADAVRLSAPVAHFTGHGVTLSGGTPLNLDFFSIKPSLKMEKVALALGLAATATQDEVVAAIGKLKAEANTEKVSLALKLAKDSGRVTAENEAKFVKLANLDLDLALEMFGQPAAETTAPAAKPATNLAAAIREVAAANAKASGTQVALNDARKDWTIRDYEKKDPAALVKLKHEQPDAYQALYNAFYGKSL